LQRNDKRCGWHTQNRLRPFPEVVSTAVVLFGLSMSFLGSVQIQARKFLFAGRRRKLAQCVVNVLAYPKGS